ncbi:TPA: hypothetical protein H1005_02170 [archaeon]|uniref:N-acetyltransferase domain-containing protein n=1 Tax=Candidatus Naiadarchaeum limnaeum TaxID=2756139 RepID=A0A832XMA6_9ARCH|nr:hypothetical protein [Candidatus Naiadarchaeales archaeon SRR2090153.bin1042]HIK00938.1 hypothetical protein [Candidatus Naiadarchaeum limnaeum]
MVVIIRNFNAKKDLQSYVDLYNSANNYHRFFQETTPKSVKELILNDPLYNNDWHFVAYDKRRFVGAVRGHQSREYKGMSPPTGQIFFAIHPGYLETAGVQLFDLVCDKMKSAGIQKVHTSPIVRNDDIWGFLDGYGFKPIYEGHTLRYRIPPHPLSLQPPAGLREKVFESSDKPRLISLMFENIEKKIQEYLYKELVWGAEQNGFFLLENDKREIVAFVKNVICSSGFPFSALISGTSIVYEAKSGVSPYLIKRSIEWARSRRTRSVLASAGTASPSLGMYLNIGFKKETRNPNIRLYERNL